MKRFGVTPLLLILINLVLASAVTFAWKRGEQRVAEPANLIISPLALPDLAALNSIPMASVDVVAIRDQAVFHTSRTFYVPPVAAVQIPQPEYYLSGTLRLPDGKRTAFVKKRGDGVSRTLHVGDDLDGWRVREIIPDHVALDLNGQTAVLTSATAGSVTTGLIRATTSSRPVLTGLHVLGATGIGAAVAGSPRSTTQAGHSEARLYRPPPQAPK